MGRIRLLGLVILAVSGCKSDPPGAGGGKIAGDGGPTGTTAKAIELRIAPTDATVVTDGVTPGRQPFSATAVFDDGTDEDVTASVAFAALDVTIGRMEAAVFVTAGRAGRTRVSASMGALTAFADVAVELRRVIIGPTGMLPNDPSTVFDGATESPSRAPKLVYPNDGVMFPPNLGSFEVHFRRGHADNELFEISLSSPLANVVIYTRCDTLQDGCRYTVEGDAFAALAQTNRGADPIRIVVRGTGDQGGEFGTSDPVSMNVAPDNVAGGIYYWTTSNGSKIMRVDFGAADRTPEQFFPFNGGGCYGCHALSPNGRRMSLSERGQHQGQLTLIDVARRDVLLTGDDNVREQFQTWNPSSDRIAGIWGDGNPPDTNIRIRDGVTGGLIEAIDVGVEPTHPDWSPDGRRIMFTAVTHHYTSQRPGRGGLRYIEHDGNAWGRPRELIAPVDGKNHYYPAYSPDATFFVYNVSTCRNGVTYADHCDGDADPSATLFAMMADGGAATQLANANRPGAEDNNNDQLSNTFPKWAPFVDRRRADGSGRLMWMTFSSRREYGLRSPRGSNQLLWMVAVDPDAIAAGRDGSYAAFALPFQDLTTSNHIAQWTTQIVDPDPDPTNTPDGGRCSELGDPCDPNNDTCCAGTSCSQNGPNIWICRPAL